MRVSVPVSVAALCLGLANPTAGAADQVPTYARTNRSNQPEILPKANASLPEALASALYLSTIDVEGSTERIVRFHDRTTYKVRCEEAISRRVVLPSTIPGLGIFYSCNGHANKIAIWLHGGPFVSATEPLAPEQVALLGAGYDLFLPFYPGSADREFTIADGKMYPGLSEAVAELNSVHAWLSQAYKGELITVGESFGALVAAKAMLSHKNEIIIFINPFFDGPQALISGFRKTERELIRKTGMHADRLAELMTAFFGLQGALSKAEIQRVFEDNDTRLVYSSTDTRINTMKFEKASNWVRRPCAVTNHETAGHQFARNLSELNDFIRIIRCVRQK